MIGSMRRGGGQLTESERTALLRREARTARISILCDILRKEAPQEIVEHHWVQPVASPFMLGSTRITQSVRTCFDPALVLQNEPEELAEARGWASRPVQKELDERVDLACGLSLHTDRRRVFLTETGSPTVLADLGEGYLIAPAEGRNLAVGQHNGLAEEIDPRDGTIFLTVPSEARESETCRLAQPLPAELRRMTFQDGAEFEQRRWPSDSSRALRDTYVVRPDGRVQGYCFKPIGDAWEGGRIEVVTVSGHLAEDGSVVMENGLRLTPWISHQQLFSPRRVSPELETYYAGEPGPRDVTVQAAPSYELRGEAGGGVEDQAAHVQLGGVRLRKRH